MSILKGDIYMLKKLFKQYKVPWVGGAKEMLAQTVFYIAMINFVLIAVVAYNSTLRGFIIGWMPGFKLWMFFGILIMLVLVAMVLEYKYIAPSLYSFRSKQMFEHESKVTDTLERIEAKLNEDKISKGGVVVAVSGGFDPIHPGHTAYIEESLKLGNWLIVILSRDDQLIEKDKLAGNIKGRMPIPYEVRKATLEWGLGNRGEVVVNIDEDITSCQSLSKYKPNIFAKGGDSWNIDNLPEKKVCGELGIEIVFGVGSYDKSQSSSGLSGISYET